MSNTYKTLVVIGKGPRNYSAHAPDVPGCVATGKSLEETLRLMQEALRMHLEGMAEDGYEMPLSADPDDEAHFVEVRVDVPVPALRQVG